MVVPVMTLPSLLLRLFKFIQEEDRLQLDSHGYLLSCELIREWKARGEGSLIDLSSTSARAAAAEIL